MAYIGDTTELEVVRISKIGLFLDGGNLEDVLLPNNELGTDKFSVGDFLEVFLYCDSEDRPIATRKTPIGGSPRIFSFPSGNSVASPAGAIVLLFTSPPMAPRTALLPLNELTSFSATKPLSMKLAKKWT